MALWDTIMVEDHLKSGKYCIRTKRLSGHHHNNKYLQFQRRSSEATLIDFDHHRSHHHWVFTSPESTTSTPFSFSSSPSATSSGRYLLSSHRRTDRRASDRGPTSSPSSTVYSPMSPLPSPSTFQSTRTHTSEVSSPSLPPLVERFDMVGSPFLPTSYQETSFEAAMSSSSSSRHYAARGAGNHGIKALGRASGGSGSSPLPSSSSSSPVKMAPSGGSSEGADDEESDGEDDASAANMHQPSSYTFRRRNAIVEGSEDAPKASEFSASGSGSE
ncbi:hypothetical protein BG000_002322 [Podila horticola]|nr:hypothetical protein BG000_002322 [Podila horticola]